MEPRNISSPGWQHNLSEGLKRDKKKTVVLAVLVVVALIVGGQLLLQKESPAGADGATATVAPIGRPDQAPVPPLAPSETAQAARDEYIQQMERHVTRDIFSLDLGQYTLIELPKPKKPVKTSTTSTRPAKPARTREEIVRSQAKLLCLQMTIVSDTPTAIINGQVLAVGDVVKVNAEGDTKPLRFRVIKITSHACVVAKDGLEVELRMK